MEEYEQFLREGSGSPKKKKKKRKSRNLEEEFNDAQQIFEDDSQEVLTQEDPNDEGTSPSKKKKKKKKRAREESEEQEESHLEAEDEAPPQVTPKKRTLTPKQTAPVSTPPARPPSVNANLNLQNFDDGLNVVAAMSEDDVEMLLTRVEAQCPVGDVKRHNKRWEVIDWKKVEFSYYGEEQCRLAWGYLMSHTRKFRIMYELVQEVKHNLKTDFTKFMKKNIETAPDYPTRPYATSGFQLFCREKWDEHKTLHDSLNKKTENFLHFQTRCNERWKKLSDAKQKEYEQKSGLLMAKYKEQVHEYGKKYPAFFVDKPKLNKDGKADPQAPQMTGNFKKRALKFSQEFYLDAPKPPLTPMQLYVQHKIKRVQPPALPSEEPELKTRYVGQWNELSKNKKLKWIEKCIKYCGQYLTEINEYKKTHPLFFLPKTFKISKLINKETFIIYAENHGLPPTPKNTVFELYLEEFRKSEEATELSSDGEIYARADQKFKELTRLQKDEYKLRFKMQDLAFKQALDGYMQSVPTFLKETAIDCLPKKYQKQFQDEVEKAPLVTEDELLEVQQNGEKTPRKRKAIDSGDVPSKKKLGDGSIPLYAEDLSDEHRKFVEDLIKESKAQPNASTYYPGKNISPSKKKKST